MGALGATRHESSTTLPPFSIALRTTYRFVHSASTDAFGHDCISSVSCVRSLRNCSLDSHTITPRCGNVLCHIGWTITIARSFLRLDKMWSERPRTERLGSTPTGKNPLDALGSVRATIDDLKTTYRSVKNLVLFTRNAWRTR